MQKFVVLGCGLVCIANVAQGAAVTSTRSTSSTETWNTAGLWSDNAVPAAGNTYTTSHTMRTASGEFAGDSLTFNSGGILATKVANQSESNLTMNNGSSIQQFHADNTTDSIGGNMTVNGTVGVGASGTGRNITLAANLSGSGTLSQNISSIAGQLTVSSDNNSSFTGSWTIAAGLLKATGTGSLGRFNTLTMTGGSFDADYEVDNPTGALVLSGGEMTLDQNFTVGSLRINGALLTPKTYTFSDLNTAYDARFADGGTGSITVVPEPTALTAVVLVAGGLLARRRRPRG